MPTPSLEELEPTDAVARLTRIALQDTGGSQVARGLIFHLVCAAEGRTQQNPGDPSYHFDLLELRRLDGQLKADALSVILWATGPVVHSYQPLYDAANKLLNRFKTSSAARGTCTGAV